MKNLKNIKWHSIKDTIFIRDGSYRDVYVENMNEEKWFKLVDHFYVQNLIGYTRIFIDSTDTNYEVMPENWRQVLPEASGAWSFNVEFLQGYVCFHHFQSEEIEATIDPGDLSSIEDLVLLIEFMDNVVNVLNLDRWFISPENCKDIILIDRIISKDEIRIDPTNFRTLNNILRLKSYFTNRLWLFMKWLRS